MVSIGVLEFDKISHVSFDAFLRGAAAPIDPFGCELRLPLGKLLSPSDVEPHIAQTRFRSGTCCNAMLIPIRPHIRDLSIRRSGDRQSQQITCKILEFFAIRHAHPDLHNIADSSHSRPSFRIICDRQECLPLLLRASYHTVTH
jgi:hypothetical protein